jgi:hypothetical protein
MIEIVEQLVNLLETAVSMLGTQYEPMFTRLSENYANSNPDEMLIACAIVRDRMSEK